MTALRRTELRHRMLGEVAAGNVAEFDHRQWVWADGGARVSPGEAAALTGFERAGLVYAKKPTYWDRSLWQPVDTANAGERLLAERNATYGEVRP